MSDAVATPPLSAPPGPRSDLALVSTVLGGVGLLASVLVVGALPALIGLGLGALHLRRKKAGRALAWTGVWLSVMALVASAGFGVVYMVASKHVGTVLSASMDPTGAWVGKPAPDAEFTALDGTTYRLSELKGRRVVLDFWATWCAPCVREIPHFQKLSEEFPPTELLVLGVTSEARSVLGPFVAAKGIKYPIAQAALDTLPEPFSQVRGLPTTFFIDREGIIRDVRLGYHDYEALRAAALGESGGSER